MKLAQCFTIFGFAVLLAEGWPVPDHHLGPEEDLFVDAEPETPETDQFKKPQMPILDRPLSRQNAYRGQNQVGVNFTNDMIEVPPGRGDIKDNSTGLDDENLENKPSRQDEVIKSETSDKDVGLRNEVPVEIPPKDDIDGGMEGDKGVIAEWLPDSNDDEFGQIGRISQEDGKEGSQMPDHSDEKDVLEAGQENDLENPDDQEDQENPDDQEDQENPDDQEDQENPDNQEDQENPDDQEDQENPDDQEDQENPDDQEDQENPDDQEDQENPDDQEDQENPDEQEDQENPDEQEDQENPDDQEDQENPDEQEDQENPDDQEDQENPDEQEDQENPDDQEDQEDPDDDGSGDTGGEEAWSSLERTVNNKASHLFSVNKYFSFNTLFLIA